MTPSRNVRSGDRQAQAVFQAGRAEIAEEMERRLEFAPKRARPVVKEVRAPFEPPFGYG